MFVLVPKIYSFSWDQCENLLSKMDAIDYEPNTCILNISCVGTL